MLTSFHLPLLVIFSTGMLDIFMASEVQELCEGASNGVIDRSVEQSRQRAIDRSTTDPSGPCSACPN